MSAAPATPGPAGSPHPAMELLLTAIREPAVALDRFSLAEWDLVVRISRRADLLGHVAASVERSGLRERVPPCVLRHLDAARLLTLRQHEEIGHEVRRLRDVLEPLGVPVVLLKGAGYVLRGLVAGQGRRVSDIDILVPRERLADVESALMLSGWVTTKADAYDQHYYRTWMHELPPLRHLRRGTVLDVHHALVPLTGSLPPASRAFHEALQAIEGWPGVCTLGPTDMVLHSAAHLYTEGELDMGLRGLIDLEALMHQWAGDDAFCQALMARADALGWQAPLAQAMRQMQTLLAWPVPPQFNAWLDQHSARQLRHPWARLTDAMYRRALRPDHPVFGGAATALARAGLYLRGHWLRMPPLMLLRHLARKAVLSLREPREQ